MLFYVWMGWFSGVLPYVPGIVATYTQHPYLHVLLHTCTHSHVLACSSHNYKFRPYFSLISDKFWRACQDGKYIKICISVFPIIINFFYENSIRFKLIRPWCLSSTLEIIWKYFFFQIKFQSKKQGKLHWKNQIVNLISIANIFFCCQNKFEELEKGTFLNQGFQTHICHFLIKQGTFGCLYIL